MAAPDGIVWGSAINDKGRIGIYTAVSNSSNNTQTTVSIQVWFWSKYGLSDTSNVLYFDTGTTSATTSKGSLSINHTVSSGSGWSTTNQTKIGTYSYTYNRSTSAQTISCAAKFANIDYVGGTMTAVTSYTIPALVSYTVSYVANGGTGAPTRQVKYYGKNITLSTVKPTRTGYTFLGWSTNQAATTATYAAGATFSTNANTNLYAVWKAVEYSITYNANGGSGAPATEYKTHGSMYTISETKPTRSGYTFLGWGTSATTTVVSYSPAQVYATNAPLTLYAVWRSNYTKPRITNMGAKRCDSSGSTDAGTENGTYFVVGFEWATDKTVSSIKVEWKATSASSWTPASISASGTSGLVKTDALGSGNISIDSTYDIRVTVADASGSTSVTRTLQGGRYEIDALIGGGGVAIGKPAETKNLFEVAYPANFLETASIKNKFIVANRCRVGQSASTANNPWYKFASINLTNANSDRRISFKVTYGYAGNTAFGTVNAYARSGTDGSFTTGGIFVESSNGLDPRKFVLAYSGKEVELWVKITAGYSTYMFEVISESTRTDHVCPKNENYSWTLYDALTEGSASAPTSGYAQIVGSDHASRVLLYDNTLIPGISNTTDDTPTNWGKLGNAKYYWYNASGKLNDQHTQYGLLQHLAYGSDARQLWFTGTDLCYRGGNSSGWSGGWKTILHDDNYDNYALPLSGGSLTGALYAGNSVNTVGYSRFNNDWIGIYKSTTDAKNDTRSNRKGWIGFDGTNNFQFTNNSGGSNITSVAWTTSSDRRLKNDIKDISADFVGVWNDLQPKIFKWDSITSSDTKHHFGLIAQDVIAAFEKYNLNHEDYGFVNSFTLPDDDTVYYGIAYDEYHMLTSMVLRKTNTLLEAQQKQIDSLQEQINEIKALLS